MRDLVFLSASRIAAAIRAHEISSVEVFEAHLDQVQRRNGELNAIVTRDEAMGRRRAREADEALARGEVWGPLHGVPITVKDAIETQGLRTTASFEPLKGHIPARDATSVARLRAAGAVIWAKTNMPALAMDYQSQSPLFGRANNPFDIARSPGGSTGGGAAAVAAGMSPFELGSDIAGSLRLPAHFCGVFSFKPTEHFVSGAGHIPELPGHPRCVRHMSCIGPIARTVEDLRLGFELIAGPDDRDWEVPPLPLAVRRARPPGELRFAWSDELGGVRAGAEVREALARLAAALTARGFHVERRGPSSFDFGQARSTWGELLGAEIGGSMPLHQRLLFQAQYRAMPGADPMSRGMARGAGFSLREYIAALWRRDLLIAELERFLGAYDAWLCPVSTVPAITHRRTGAYVEVDGKEMTYHLALGAYTCIFNVTGHPMILLPIGRSEAGLPIGMQLVGPRWSDTRLLDIAEELAKVTGPFERPPGY